MKQGRIKPVVVIHSFLIGLALGVEIQHLGGRLISDEMVCGVRRQKIRVSHAVTRWHGQGRKRVRKGFINTHQLRKQSAQNPGTAQGVREGQRCRVWIHRRRYLGVRPNEAPDHVACPLLHR